MKEYFVVNLSNVKELKQGRKVEYIAEKLGMHRVSLSYILNGRKIQRDLAEKILQVCTNSLDDFDKYFKKI